MFQTDRSKLRFLLVGCHNFPPHHHIFQLGVNGEKCGSSCPAGGVSPRLRRPRPCPRALVVRFRSTPGPGLRLHAGLARPRGAVLAAQRPRPHPSPSGVQLRLAGPFRAPRSGPPNLQRHLRRCTPENPSPPLRPWCACMRAPLGGAPRGLACLGFGCPEPAVAAARCLCSESLSACFTGGFIPAFYKIHFT